MRILVVDDDAMSRELWTMLLESEGYVVQATESGEEALTVIGAESAEMPEVVLTDMQMPGIAGNELARALRVNLEGVLIVAMSGSQPTPEALDEFDGFLLKPFTVEGLEEAIVRAKIRTGKSYPTKVYVTSEHDGTGPAMQATGNSEESCGLDEAVFTRLSSAMPEARLRELYALCLNDATMRIQGMRAALEAEDEVTFRSLAHAIKGGCGMVGALELQEIAGQLEEQGLTLGRQRTMITLERFLITCEKFERMLGRRWVCS